VHMAFCRWESCFLVCVVLALAEAKCSSDWDCNLNGACTADGQCHCLSAWQGATCGELALQPAKPRAGLHAGSGVNMSSWGGDVGLDERTGRWTMFAAEMVGGCGINSWQSNSQIVRAVADEPDGEYVVDAVLQPAFAHEPVLARLANGSWLLYSIGNDTAHPSGPLQEGCRGGYTPKRRLELESQAKGLPWCVGKIAMGGTELTGQEWREVATFGFADFNPAPLILANGTTLLMSRHLATIHFLRAESWLGPYPFDDANLFDDEVVARGVEDPFLFRQRSASNASAYTFHALFHDHKSFGGHAFSLDGLTWNYSSTSPYGRAVVFTDNRTIQMQRRERPHLILDQQGFITHLSTSVQPPPLPNQARPSDDFENDHSYTLIQPVRPQLLYAHV